MTKHKRVIGIIGGMGPVAGLMLHKYIYSAAQNLLTIKRDADFPEIIHLSFPASIPDRTDYLLGLSEENPGAAAIPVAKLLAEKGKMMDYPVVACVACNAFHAKPIWDIFIKEVNEFDNLEMLHLVNTAVEFIEQEVLPSEKIAVFATIGLSKEKLYESMLASRGFNICPLSPEQQQDVHRAIYDHEFGLKANPRDIKKACNLVRGVVESLKEQKVKKIIFGCTELSIAFPYGSDPIFIDPMMIMAEKIVRLSQEE